MTHLYQWAYVHGMTGQDLRRIRRSADVTVTALALEMRHGRVTIHRRERLASVPAPLAVAYMAAVAAIVLRRPEKGRAA